jgi:DNA-binding GntR family transcriptional regulator
MLENPWSEASSVTLFEMNAEFHLGISAASGNRYIEEAMQRQNQLRRLSNYNWQHGADRVEVTCREHIEILDRLEHGDNEVAAALMRKHLAGARGAAKAR